MRISWKQGSEDGKLTGCMRRMKGRVCERAPAFYKFISIILFALFLLVNTFFPILCRFTHISFQPLDFLYFIPLLYGNDTFTHRYSMIQIGCKYTYTYPILQSLVLILLVSIYLCFICVQI